MKKLLALSITLLTVAAFSARAEDAKALYERDCAKCHGTDGKGDTKMGHKLGVKDYSDPKVQDALTDAAAAKAIKEGLAKDGRTVMRPTEGVSDQEVKDLVAYMRTLKK